MSHRFAYPKIIVALCALALAAGSALAAQPKAAPAKKPAKVEQPVGELVEYADLEHRVGQGLVIETTLKTVRRGTLVKYTQPALTLKLGPESGSIELTVPRETIKTVRVLPQAAAEATTTEAGKSGAKKN